MTQQLVQDILAGSETAWHRFVDDYSGLIFAIVKRYLLAENEDERRTVYVGILDCLYREKLRQYDGSSGLATWVAVVSRSRCLDHLRHAHGRRNVPRWVKSLSGRDQRVFRLYFVEGLDTWTIRQRLARRGAAIPFAELAEVLCRLEAGFDRGSRRKAAYDLYARSIGATSGRLLEYVDQLAAECAARAEASDPEEILHRREIGEQVEALRRFLRRLSPQEREVLDRRFFREHTAQRIAEDLQLSDRRRAYTLIERGLRRLREMFAATAGTETVDRN